MGLTYFKRYRMEINLVGRDLSRATARGGYRLLSWDRSLVDGHAEAKYRSFRGEIDANVFPCLGELVGCQRLMNEISRKRGFLPEATWLISYPTVLAVGQFLNVILTYFFQIHEVEQLAVRSLKMIMDFPLLYLSTVVSMVLFVPIMEELIFRGYLQTWLKGLLGRSIAIVLTSAIFALFHFSISQGASNIEYVVALFMHSSFLCFV